MALSLKSIFSSLRPEALESAARVVGIDIGSSSIKVVEIEQTDRAPVVRTYGELQLGPYADTEIGRSVKLENKERLAALIDVFREAGVTARKGALALPLSASFVTVVPLKLGKKEEVDTRITVEARKYIPIPLQDVTLDWVELPTGDDDPNRIDILLVAIQNTVLAEMNQLLLQAEMPGQPTELEIFSLIRAVTSDTAPTFAVLDIGANHSCLYIVKEGLTMQVHRSNIGGVAITERIAREQNISFEEAELQKRTAMPGAATYDTVRRLTAQVLADPLAEFRRLIHVYEGKTGESIDSIVATGGVSTMYDAAAYFNETLQIKTTVADPFSKVAYPAFMEDTLRSIGPTFTASIGAALRLLE